jgi:hypothetical protein
MARNQASMVRRQRERARQQKRREKQAKREERRELKKEQDSEAETDDPRKDPTIDWSAAVRQVKIDESDFPIPELDETSGVES